MITVGASGIGAAFADCFLNAGSTVIVTDLGGVGLHTFGAPLNDFADSVFGDLSSGKQEVGYGCTEERLHVSALEAKELAIKMYEGFKNR